MAKKLRQEQFRDFLVSRMRAMKAVKQELEEIQSAFTTRYLEFKARHDATLVRLTEQVLEQFDQLPPPLRSLIEEQFAQEQRKARERREELKHLIPQLEEEVDGLLKQAQRKAAVYRKQNPEYDQREETLKASIAQLRADIQELDAQIKRLSKGLGFLLHMHQIDKADRERQRKAGKYETLVQELHAVRNEWEKKRDTFMRQQADFQEQWRTKHLQLTSLRAELELLSNDEQLEHLARKRAVYAVLDALKDPALCDHTPLTPALQEMLVLNHQTDDFQEGLGAVASLIAWLDGLEEGMESIKKSVDALIQQQRMHSAHLKPLTIELPEQAELFHRIWEPLRDRVKDDAHLSKVPLEFVATVQPVLEHVMNEHTVGTMFDNLGNALKRATRAWG